MAAVDFGATKLPPVLAAAQREDAATKGTYLHKTAKGAYLHKAAKGAYLHKTAKGAYLHKVAKGAYLHKAAKGAYLHKVAKATSTLATSCLLFCRSMGGDTFVVGRLLVPLQTRLLCLQRQKAKFQLRSACLQLDDCVYRCTFAATKLFLQVHFCS